MKRYTITIDFYQHSENDKEALQKAQDFVTEINARMDCQANVLEIHETPFACLSARKVDIQKIVLNDYDLKLPVWLTSTQ